METISSTITLANKTRKTSRVLFTNKGFTFTETMIVMAFVGFIMLAGASQLQWMSSFEKNVTQRLMDDFELVTAYKQVINDFRGSYWARVDLFDCPTSSNILRTNSTGALKLERGDDEKAELQFVTVTLASTVGLADRTDTLVVAEAQKLRVGDMVMLSLISSMRESTIFVVKSVDPETKLVEVARSSLDSLSGDVDCADHTQTKNIKDFFDPSVNSNVILSRLEVVRYSLKGEKLYRQLWPSAPAESLFISGVEKIEINTSWQSMSTATDNSIDNFGTLSFDILLRIEEGTLVTNIQKEFKNKSLKTQFTLNSFHISNVYSPLSSVPDAAHVFPTCMIEHEFRPGILKIHPSLELYRNAVPIRISGSISQHVNTASINVNFSPSEGSTVQCFKYNPDDGSPTNVSLGQIQGPGLSNSLTLNQAGTGFDVYTCATRGYVDINASMSYYDSNINQVKTIDCTSEPISSPVMYRFTKNQIPRCWRYSKSWNLGSPIVGDLNPVSLGYFAIDKDTSCEWSGDSGDNRSTGVASDCNSFWRPFQSLKRIYLRPYKIDVATMSGATSIFPPQGAYIDCE